MDPRQIKLTPRLSLIYEMTGGVVCADIGTDHALLPCALVRDGRAARAFASDINPGPLRRARDTVAAFGLEDRIELLQCDGVPPRAAAESDSIIIAGMGGETIAGILARAAVRPQTQLLLQPMTRAAQLRGYLCENGYAIVRERLAREADRIYVVLEAYRDASRADGMAYSAAALEAGRFADEDIALARAYVGACYKKLCKKLEGRRKGGEPAGQTAALAALIRAIEEEYHDFIRA